jgi:cytochrome c-type biogenesis protein
VLDGLLANAGDYVHTNPWLAIAAVFTGGLLTASNPCVLAMIPLMMGFVAGRREGQAGAARAFGYSLAFVAGLGVTFAALGVIAALAGTLYGETSAAWGWVVAGVCLLMGLHLTGLLTIPMPQLQIQPRLRGAAGAFVLGLLFGFVSAPCAAPILVVLLTYLAGAQASVAWGAALLLVYALGHSVLILVAGTSMGLARKLIESGRVTKATERLRQVAGLLIIGMGVYFAWSAW